MLEIKRITKRYGKRESSFEALSRVNMKVADQEIVALVGESGSGKSTLAELVSGLQQPTEGEILWSPEVGSALVTSTTSRASRQHHKSIQMVFQNPDRSLNPYWRIKEIVAEPLRLAGVPKKQAWQQAASLLRQTGLPEALLERRPNECSGGQKQRVAIARALCTKPQLLIADEITSALDTQTEKGIMQLLLALRIQTGMSMLYITHRLDVLDGFADRIVVMKQGQIIETGTVHQVLRNPQQAYTRKLLEASFFA
ncbi:ABC transporter ATP-binding protein [Paenibacillus sanguinis]|uniref:ABC transporter ATP-binding protein n=1 Tax=Paenibacillus sanguinis TaxID=225906 RepID=UPI000372ADF9|nr:ABC transporter ATP-binding protein [Paenibacillus sanguinis]